MNQHSRDIPEQEQPLAERFRITAVQYCDADAAASLMEELKSVTLSKMKADIIERDGAMADNKCELLAKCDPQWTTYIKDMCGHRARATKLKLKLEYLRILDRKEDREAWAARTEQRMSR
jgi:hypothetical protein